MLWLQTSSEVFFRKVSFWDKGGRDAPPVFNVDGVSYLYVKVASRAHSCLLEGAVLPSESTYSMHSIVLGSAQEPLGLMAEAASCHAVQDGGVLLVATTRENVSPSLVLELLKRIGGIIKVHCLLVMSCLAV